MNNFLLVIIFLCIFNMITPIECKIVEGSFSTDKKWTFLTKFCFTASDNKWKLELSFSSAYCPIGQFNIPSSCQALALYFDGSDQWNSVYESGESCAEKTALKTENSGYLEPRQLLYMDPTGRYYSLEGNFGVTESCKYHNGDSEILCNSTRSFLSRRPRWWYFAVSNCNSTLLGTQLAHYKFTFTNGDSYQKHFSFDELYIFEMDIAAVIIFIVMLVYTVSAACVLRSKRLLHPTYIIYTVSITIKLLSWIVLAVAYSSYQMGYELLPVKRMGMTLNFVAYFLLLIMIMLLAKGCTVTRGFIPMKSRVTLGVFLLCYIIAFATAAIV